MLRGKWILDNLFGTPPPAPPALVPPLKENSDRDRPLTMREQMEEHRANPPCAGCHKLMDPLGFALENFDGVGAWRTSDLRVPIDPSSELADGTRVAGPSALRQTLAAKPGLFVATMTEKMLTFASDAASNRTTCPRFGRLCATPPGPTTASRRSCSVWSGVPFQMRARAIGES